MKNDASERLLELVHELLTPATQAEFAALVATLPAAEQAHWLNLRAEADILHSALAEVPTPDLTPRLLGILGQKSESKKTAMPLRQRIYLYAASIVIILAVTSWFYLNQRPALPVALPAAQADPLADAAVRLHESPPALDISSADPKVVQAALQSTPMPFPPILLNPSAKLTLIGGGHTTLDGVPCLFTRWKSATATFTLCQFDGKPLNIPQSFVLTRSAPKSLWHDALHYQVVFWPGQGACTWALVLENETLPDNFSNAY